jgi:hypothetical protein
MITDWPSRCEPGLRVSALLREGSRLHALLSGAEPSGRAFSFCPVPCATKQGPARLVEAFAERGLWCPLPDRDRFDRMRGDGATRAVQWPFRSSIWRRPVGPGAHRRLAVAPGTGAIMLGAFYLSSPLRLARAPSAVANSAARMRNQSLRGGCHP